LIRLLRQLIISVGTYGTLVALVFTLKHEGKPFSTWQQVLFWSAMAIFAADVVFIVRGYTQRPQRRFRQGVRQQRRIRDFMHAWLSTGARVAVFSRDLSWVKDNDDEMRSLLLKKARNDELTVVVPASTSLTRELGDAGAEVVTYPDLDYVIQSRFTLVGIGRAGGRVAIGHSQEGMHVIDVLDAPDPAFYMADDLVEVMRRIAMKRPA
jgi:hypothetical protein